jgi:multidrug resistance efflux pump
VTGRAQSPREVLEAVRRLEADLDAIRARARERERDLSEVRAAIAADAARERQALVEDLERLVDLIGASWRSTRDQVASLSEQIEDLRRFAERTAGSLRDARLELRLGGALAHNGTTDEA